jgi:hypothetical protein
MPAPREALSTLRPDLGGSFQDFDTEMDRLGFIAGRVLPVLEVQRASGTFGRIPLAQLLKNSDVKRTSRSGYPRGDWEFEEETFATKEFGFEEPVDARDENLYKDFFDAEMISAELARDTVLREAEKRVAAMIFNTTTWTGASLTTAVGTVWTTAATAVPITDVEGAVKKVYDLTGLWPNALIVNRRVFRLLRNVQQVIDRIASSGAGNRTLARDITVDMLREVFDLDYILVAGASKNTANEGQAATPGQVWSGANAMVCRIATTRNIKEPCVGRTFHWAEDGSQLGGAMETYDDPKIRGEVVRCRHEVQEKVIEKNFGHLLTNIGG